MAYECSPACTPLTHHTTPHHTKTGITSMAFSRDSLQLATASFDGVRPPAALACFSFPPFPSFQRKTAHDETTTIHSHPSSPSQATHTHTHTHTQNTPPPTPPPNTQDGAHPRRAGGQGPQGVPRPHELRQLRRLHARRRAPAHGILGRDRQGGWVGGMWVLPAAAWGWGVGGWVCGCFPLLLWGCGAVSNHARPITHAHHKPNQQPPHHQRPHQHQSLPPPPPIPKHQQPPYHGRIDRFGTPSPHTRPINHQSTTTLPPRMDELTDLGRADVGLPAHLPPRRGERQGHGGGWGFGGRGMEG